MKFSVFITSEIAESFISMKFTARFLMCQLSLNKFAFQNQHCSRTETLLSLVLCHMGEDAVTITKPAALQ